jgi:large subunit ribosomal protein L18
MGEYNTKKSREVRHKRVRKSVSGTAERPRLCVYRSLSHIYCQLIDDSQGHTLVSASTLDNELKSNDKKKAETAASVGKLIAERASESGIKKVVFDRGGYQYHGRVKALADAARKAGLEF